jgi:type IV pilus assembly protein PilV
MKNDRGMTLIEAMIAIVISFVIFIGLSATGVFVLNENIKNTMRDEAVGVAENEVADAGTLLFANLTDNTHHVFRQIRGLNVDYTVARTVTDPDGSTPPDDPNHRRVTINVSWTRWENNAQKVYSHQVMTIMRRR